MLPAGSIVGTLYQGCTVIKTSHLPIRYFLALLWAHPILHISTIRVNSYEHRSFTSTSHPFTTVPYVPAHLLPSFPITYFRMASSPKLCKHFLTHYPNNTSYGTSCTSAVSLRGLQPFASCGMWGGGGFRSVCVWRQRLKVKVAKRAFPLTKHPHRNINLYIRSCLVRMFCYNAR